MDWLTTTALALAAALASWWAEPERPDRYRAIDGDTLEHLRTRERIRLSNIDAPELDGPCRAKALQAQRLAQEAIDSHRVTISRQGVDRYGRTLAAVDIGGQDLGDYLIASGVARKWGSRRGVC